MKTGLVLEGGAMRGMYTTGILDVFLDEGVKPDGIIGVSAGALFGVNFVSGQRSRSLNYSKRFNGDKRYMGLGPLFKTGNIVSTEFAYEIMPHKLDVFDEEAYEANGTPFYAGVTNIETGRAEYIRIRSVFDQMDALRASASMPYVSRPVELYGKKYLDGGIAAPIPCRKMLKLGYDRLIVVLTRDINYKKKPMSPVLIDLFYTRRYPAFARVMKRRHLLYEKCLTQLTELEKEGRAFVYRPSSPIEIGRLEKDPQKLQAVYDLGLADGKARLAELEEFLQSN